MATTKLFSFLLLLLLLPLAFPSSTAADPDPTKPAQRAVAVAVEGMVFCQNCKKVGTWSLTDAKPIGSAKISVICKNYRNQVTFYKVYQTKPNGYFYAELVGYKMIHPVLDHPLQACKVKPVSSPLPDCNLLTNINYGLSGAPLRYENKIVVGKHYKAAVYAAGPLAFHPDKCF